VSRRLTAALQVLASAAVLVLLVRDAEWGRVRAALAGADLGWLVAATGIKAVGLTLHELRIWVSLLPFTRAPLRPVIEVGFVAGLLNGVLPVRGGDLVAVALLKREAGVSATVALAAVAITGFGEALVFGVFLLGVMGLGLSRWEELLGAARAGEALGALSLLTLGAIFGAVAVVLIGRRFTARGDAPARPGPRVWLRQAVVDAGRGLSASGPIALNLALCVVHVALVVGTFTALFPAAGLSPPVPLLAACALIAVGSLAAVVLPPGLGGGQAAASVFVLAFFGVDEAHALAYAALAWVANTLPPAALGVGPLYKRLGALPTLMRGGADASGRAG